MAEEEKDKLSRTTKLIVAVTGLLVAVGTLVGAISVTLGGGGRDAPPYSYTVIHLGDGDGMTSYDDFLRNHPSGG